MEFILNDSLKRADYLQDHVGKRIKKADIWRF